MNIIDQTPYVDPETGKISFLDRGMAIFNYGPGWFKEIDAQSQVIAVMSKLLDKNFTLLRNVTPPALGAKFPLILVGPTGVYVMNVTPLTGTFRAKGDQWGTISGNSFRDEKPNLLTRTERMARALQIYLQHQGQTELAIVEAILLCSDPAIHVDSLRPIIRIVMRDALERFIVSITQARVAFTQDAVQKTIDRLLNPPAPVQPQPAETEPEVKDEAPVDRFNELIHASIASQPPGLNAGTENPPLSKPPSTPLFQSLKGMNKRQLAILIIMFVFWIILVAFFGIIILRGQVPSLKSLLP